jgi:gliding motility-associated-like protein
VTVEDINGCKNRDSSRILIYGKTVLLIPSGFSPNGDSKNDIFRISKHLNIKTLNSFEVYNRWGEKVFSTNKINEGWDGTHRGEPANTGVYVWKIEATTFENEKFYESGNVTLIR